MSERDNQESQPRKMEHLEMDRGPRRPRTAGKRMQGCNRAERSWTDRLGAYSNKEPQTWTCLSTKRSTGTCSTRMALIMRYSTSWDCMRLVVERMRRLGFDFGCHTCFGIGPCERGKMPPAVEEWAADFHWLNDMEPCIVNGVGHVRVDPKNMHEDWAWPSHDESLPTSVCRAALNALKGKGMLKDGQAIE